MEENLLITRKVIDDYPVRIEYSVTAYGLGLEEIAKPLGSWGKKHQKKVRGK